jgi:hypothetical protein
MEWDARTCREREREREGRNGSQQIENRRVMGLRVSYAHACTHV